MGYKITSAEGIISFIEDIELQFNPQQWVWMDIDIWPVLRVNLYYELSLILINGSVETGSKSEKIKRVLNAFFRQQRILKNPKDVLFVSDGISYQLLNNRLYEKFCDPLIDILEQEKHSWTKWDIAGELKGNWVYKPSKLNPSLDFLNIYSKLKSIDVPLNNEMQLTLQKLTEFISLNTKGKINWTVNSLNAKFFYLNSMVSWFTKNLEKIKPKLVLIVSFYSDRGMALIKACRDLNIKTADIQHGVQGNLHAAYSFWKNVPANGFNTLPNDYLVWTNREVVTINAWAENTIHKAIKIGNLFEERWYNDDDGLVKEIDKLVEKLIARMKAPKTVLFTLQYGIQYSDEILEFIKLSQDKFNWLIRLHPVMQNIALKEEIIKRLSKFGIRNYEIEQTSVLPLYSLLRNVNIHVTHSSTAVIEALNFGLHSILLDPYGVSLFQRELDNNKVVFCESKEQRLNQLNIRAKNIYRNSAAWIKDLQAQQRMQNYLSEKI